MREHAGARGERELRARPRSPYRPSREARSGGARRAGTLRASRGARPRPPSGQQPARARGAHVGRARRPAGRTRAPPRARRGSVRFLAALGPLPRGARRRRGGARRHAPAARLQPDRRDAGAAGPRPLPRRGRERHRRAAARLPSGRGRRRGGRLRRAAEVAGPGSLPRAAGRHPLRAQPPHVSAPAARPADEHADRPVHRGRRQPARRPLPGSRAVALLPGARRPARRVRLLPPALCRPRPQPRQPLRGSVGRGDRRRPRRRVSLRRSVAGSGPLRRTAHRLSRRPGEPAARRGRAARGSLRLLRLPQEDGAHAAQRGRHGPRRHAVPRRLYAPRAGRRPRRGRAHHRRHGHRQVGDAGGAARRRRRAHP